MRQWRIKIKGFTPLMWNRPKKELFDELKKVKKDRLTEWEEQNWKRKAEYDSEENLIIPFSWIRGCFILACQRCRVIPHFATSKKETYTFYMQSVFFQDVTSPGKVKDLIAYIEFVNRGTKMTPKRVWVYRPKLEKWETEFTIIDHFGRIREDELREIGNFAGFMIGIGEGRKNNFGRFEIAEIKQNLEGGKK